MKASTRRPHTPVSRPARARLDSGPAPREVRRRLLLIVAIVMLAATGGCDALFPRGTTPAFPGPASLPPLPELSPPVLIGAGDIAGCGILDEDLDRPRDLLRVFKKLTGEIYYDEHLTAELLDSIPGVVFTTGDNAYPRGRPEDFEDCYHPSWGKHRNRTRPSAGNHDFGTPGASGYFEYFGALAGDPAKGYYSYRLGGWHILVLNTVLDLGVGSAQLEWVRSELATNGSQCTLAYGHDPRFSSGEHGGEEELQPLWELLHESGVEALISGHDHNYERFAPLSGDGRPDPVHGVRQFVVGTGGAYLRPIAELQPHSEVVDHTSHGLLKLTLHPDRYDWEFVPVRGDPFTDRGSRACHDPPSRTP
jgi:acid phosphatase type 7